MESKTASRGVWLRPSREIRTELNAAIVKTTTQREGQLGAIEKRLDECQLALSETRSKVSHLEQQLANLSERDGSAAVERLDERLSSAEREARLQKDQLESLSSEQEAERAQVRSYRGEYEALRVAMADLEVALSQRSASLAERVEAVAAATPWESDMAQAGRRIEEVRYAVDELMDEIYCAPYLSDPEALLVKQADGRRP